jgi:hypothetical protein
MKEETVMGLPTVPPRDLRGEAPNGRAPSIPGVCFLIIACLAGLTLVAVTAALGASAEYNVCNGHCCDSDVTHHPTYYTCTATTDIYCNSPDCDATLGWLTKYDGYIKLKFSYYFDDSNYTIYDNVYYILNEGSTELTRKHCDDDCSGSLSYTWLVSSGTQTHTVTLHNHVSGVSPSCSDDETKTLKFTRPKCPSAVTVTTNKSTYYYSDKTATISGTVKDNGCYSPSVATPTNAIKIEVNWNGGTWSTNTFVSAGTYSCTFTFPTQLLKANFGPYTVKTSYNGTNNTHPLETSWTSKTFQRNYTSGVALPPGTRDAGAVWGGDVALAVPFATDAHFLLLCGTTYPVVQGYRIEDPEQVGTIELHALDGTSPRGLAAVPDVYGGGGGYRLLAVAVPAQGKIKFFDMWGGFREERSVDVATPWGVVYDGEGLWVASHAANGEIALINMTTWQRIRTLNPNIGRLTDISWDSPTQSLLALVEGGSVIYRLNPTTGAVLETLPLRSMTHRTVMNYEDCRFVVDFDASELYLWDQRPGDPGMPTLAGLESSEATLDAIHLAWTDPEWEPTWSSIHVYRDGSFLTSVPPGTEEYLDQGLADYSFHDYFLTAYRQDDGRESVHSDTLGIHAGGRRAPMKLRVPGTYSSIPTAMGNALEGDTIWVAAGHYQEPFRFGGRNIKVLSESGPTNTFLDGENYPGSLVVFDSTETRSAILSGFTIRGTTLDESGVIWCGPDASPTIEGNILTNNTILNEGGVILCEGGGSGSPLIHGNTIAFNRILADTLGLFQGGIITLHDSGAEVVQNIIAFNDNARGIYCDGQSQASLGCNDLFGNELGGYFGCAPGSGDISLDPRFCGGASGDLSLCADSPCLAPPGCDPIGALGQGCGACGTVLDYANHDVGNGVLTVTDQGIVGFMDGTQAQGSGFVYPRGGANRLYIGSLWVGTDSAYVANRDYDVDPRREWVVSQDPDGHVWVNGYGNSDQDILGRITDAGAAQPKGLSVQQESWAYSDAARDDFVILRYLVENRGTQPLSHLYVGLFSDFDIGASYDNSTGGTDPGRHLVYMTDPSGIHCGLKVLMGVRSPDGEAVHDPPANLTLIHNPTYVWPLGYIPDADKYAFLAGSDPQHVLQQASSPTDYGMLASVGPIALGPGQMREVAFAMIGGESLADLVANADQAQIGYLFPSGSPDPAFSLGGSTRLHSIYPNPFASRTVIPFTLVEPGEVRLDVYDIAGRRVERLVSGWRAPGTYEAAWDPAKGTGPLLGSGIYFIRLRVGDAQDERAVVLIK